MNRNRVEQSVETVADANLIVVNDRWLCCLAAVTPLSSRRFSIDPTTDRLGGAKPIRNGNVMPPGPNRKSKLRIPAMPVCFAVRQLCCKQETEFRFILRADNPH